MYRGLLLDSCFNEMFIFVLTRMSIDFLSEIWEQLLNVTHRLNFPTKSKSPWFKKGVCLFVCVCVCFYVFMCGGDDCVGWWGWEEVQSCLIHSDSNYQSTVTNSFLTCWLIISKRCSFRCVFSHSVALEDGSTRNGRISLCYTNWSSRSFVSNAILVLKLVSLVVGSNCPDWLSVRITRSVYATCLFQENLSWSIVFLSLQGNQKL